MNPKVDHVNYFSLDEAKNSFIQASKKTLDFASDFGKVLKKELGASANIFELDISKLNSLGVSKMHISLLTEGLGTADDARPEDLSEEELYRFWHNIGIKTVSSMTNDASSAGIQPILISLYLPSSTPETVFNQKFIEGFLDGFVEGCKRVKCVYISGETPQLKTKIYPDKIDIAGAVFGAVAPGYQPITGEELSAGDTIVFVESSGPHENGFTTLRALSRNLKDGYRTKLPSGKEYWEAINAPSNLYAPLIQRILKEKLSVSSIENITGHGWQKIMRSKKSFKYQITNPLPIPELFNFIRENLEIDHKQMMEIFNYGVGLVLFFTDRKDAENSIKLATEIGLKAQIAGVVEESDRNTRSVNVEKFKVILEGKEFKLQK